MSAATLASIFKSSMDLSIVPVVPPPLGLVPNFNNPPSRGYEVIITVAICLSAMVPIVSMRIYTRVVISRSLGWDDCELSRRSSYSGF